MTETLGVIHIKEVVHRDIRSGVNFWNSTVRADFDKVGDKIASWLAMNE
jgi:hypothetical protein